MSRGLSPREFALDLKKFGEVTDEQADLIVRKIVLDLDSAVVLSTPVDTGRARGNWFPSIQSPSNEVDEKATDKSGAKALARIQETASKAKAGDVIWLTNNLPYILPLENGHSAQAPEGMVDRALAAAANQFGGAIE